MLALLTDSFSADEFVPTMAYVLARASPPRLASDVCSVVNFSFREDFEEMW